MTWSDLSEILPVEYKNKHLTEAMRVKDWRIELSTGRRLVMRMLCKIGRDVPPRDITKLKDRLAAAARFRVREKPVDVDALSLKLIHACYSSQKLGMCKYLLKYYICFFSVNNWLP